MTFILLKVLGLGVDLGGPARLFGARCVGRFVDYGKTFIEEHVVSLLWRNTLQYRVDRNKIYENPTKRIYAGDDHREKSKREK